MLISASWHVLPWCLHGMLVTCFGRKNWRIEHSKVLYTPVSQPCSKRPVWVPFPLNANELLRAQPKDGICIAHFFPPAEDVRTASCYYGNTWVWGRNGCRSTNCGATLYVRARVSVGRLWVFFAGVSVSKVPKLQKLIFGSFPTGGGVARLSTGGCAQSQHTPDRRPTGGVAGLVGFPGDCTWFACIRETLLICGRLPELPGDLGCLSVSRLCVCALLGWVLWAVGGCCPIGGALW